MNLYSKQYYCHTDKLRDYKQEQLSRYQSCNFFSKDLNNPIQITVNNGKIQNQFISEKIISDGFINLQKINKEPSYIVWQECAIKLNNNESIIIHIENYSFFVVDTQFGHEHRYDIYTPKESELLYSKILEYLYEKKNHFIKLDTITFKTPTTLIAEHIYQNCIKKEILDLKKGKSKILH